MIFTSWLVCLSIGVAVLLTAALLRAYSKRYRRRIQRMATFYLIYTLAVAVYKLSQALTWQQVQDNSAHVVFFMAWLSLIEIFSHLFFRLFLPKFSLRPPSIISELFLGVAFIVLTIVTLSRLGVDTTGIAATSAVVTAILALGLQATLGNVIGGVALQLDRSIRVGDWIELENGKQGRIQQIRWRHTVIETRNWDTIIVPNSALLAANITILGKREGEPIQHRMWVYFNVDFRTNPEHVIDVVERSIQAKPLISGVAKDPKPNCICFDFASENRESYVLYAVRYWLTNLQDDDPTNSLIRQRLYAALQRANIPFAIPAAHYFIDQNTEARQKRKQQRRIEKRLAALAELAFLQDLTEDEVLHLAQSLQPVLFSQGENIMVQNEQADWLYILTEGSVDVWVSNGEQNKKVANLTAPTFFGEMGLMTGEPRSATIVALNDVHCFRLYKDAFESILHQRPVIAENISKILATRQVETSAVRSSLDSAAKHQQIEQATDHLLDRISDFFGLS